MKKALVKVRIAPSPTGPLHIGTVRTAFINWLFARKHEGVFVLRIEDTDLERSDKKFETDIMEGLKWLGIEWDDGPIRQSERIVIYKKYIKKLLEEEKAFWCFHSIEELEAEHAEQMKRKEAPRHICEYKTKSGNVSKASESKKGIVRLAVNQNSTKSIHFKDCIRGDIKFEERNFGDISIAKDLHTPLYNFAVVVDDYEMAISHVIRGEDHISNTPKQLLIQEMLGFPRPVYAHLPLILGPDKSKLSKRHGAISVNEYKKDYLPEALINFMGFLGFTYSKEIISLTEMVREFELGKVHKSGAIFNIDKLNWINTQYIKKMPPSDLKKQNGFESLSDEALVLVTDRLEKLGDIKEFVYLFEDPDYERELLIWKDTPEIEIKNRLLNIKAIVSSKIEWEIFDKEYIRKELDNLNPADRGVVYWPLRVALTGKKKSPDPVDIMSVLGRETVFRRIDIAIKKLR